MKDVVMSAGGGGEAAFPTEWPVELGGDGIVLRELGGDDAESLVAVFGDPEVVRYLWLPVQTLDSETTFLTTVAEEARRVPRREYHFAVTTGARGEVIGSCRLGVESIDHRSASLGYGIRRDMWGRGIGTELVRLLVEFGFETLHLHRVWATHHADNSASGRVLVKAGFVPEGRIRDDFRVEEQRRDSLVYSLVVGDWRLLGGSQRSNSPTLIVVTGAPGSGKSVLAPLVARALPDVAVFDIDALMEPVNAMLGEDIRSRRSVWPAYRKLWMTVLGAARAAHRPLVFFANALPSEIEDPARQAGVGAIGWLILDCGDDTRVARLRLRGEPDSVIEEASNDAAELRRLSAPIVTNDSAATTAVASDIIRTINALLIASRRTQRDTQ